MGKTSLAGIFAGVTEREEHPGGGSFPSCRVFHHRWSPNPQTDLNRNEESYDHIKSEKSLFSRMHLFLAETFFQHGCERHPEGIQHNFNLLTGICASLL